MWPNRSQSRTCLATECVVAILLRAFCARLFYCRNIIDPQGGIFRRVSKRKFMEHLTRTTLHWRIGFQGGVSMLGFNGTLAPRDAPVHEGRDLTPSPLLNHFTDNQSERYLQKINTRPPATLIHSGSYSVTTVARSGPCTSC